MPLLLTKRHHDRLLGSLVRQRDRLKRAHEEIEALRKELEIYDDVYFDAVWKLDDAIAGMKEVGAIRAKRKRR